MEAGKVVRAVFEFLPSVSEELPLFTGDVIEVLSVVDEFWLLGNKDGVTGNVSGVIIFCRLTSTVEWFDSVGLLSTSPTVHRCS